MVSPAKATAQLMSAPKDLKIQVIAPPTLNLLNDNRLTEAFISRVREAFNRSGFPIQIQAIRPVEDAAKVPYTLTIKVAAWKLDPAGDIDCTFTATLKTPQRTQDLSVFSNTTVQWRGSIDRLGASNPIVNVNNEAFYELCNEICASFGQPHMTIELSA